MTLYKISFYAGDVKRIKDLTFQTYTELNTIVFSLPSSKNEIDIATEITVTQEGLKKLIEMGYKPILKDIKEL